MDFLEAQMDVVKATVACLPDVPWQAAILDIELREFPDGFDTDHVGIVLKRGRDGGLEQDQFTLDRAARDSCVGLYRQRKDDAGEVIAGFVLRIEHPGLWRFDFKDRTRRLDGVWDAAAERYLETYLDHYLREKAAGPDA